MRLCVKALPSPAFAKTHVAQRMMTKFQSSLGSVEQHCGTLKFRVNLVHLSVLFGRFVIPSGLGNKSVRGMLSLN